MTTQTDKPASAHDSTRDAILQAALEHCVFDGWTRQVFDRSAKDAGIDAGEALLACPRRELDLIAHWSRQLDRDAAARIATADLASMKIRERVTFGVTARLEALDGHEEAGRRARARLLLPDAGTEASKLLWATSDMIWRAIGDTSTDVNFYSKRTILSGVYASTLASWLGDMDHEKTEARAFLDRRIQNVMDFEKTKAQFTKMTDQLPDLASILGKMRYGPGPRI